MRWEAIQHFTKGFGRNQCKSEQIFVLANNSKKPVKLKNGLEDSLKTVTATNDKFLSEAWNYVNTLEPSDDKSQIWAKSSQNISSGSGKTASKTSKTKGSLQGKFSLWNKKNMHNRKTRNEGERLEVKKSQGKKAILEEKFKTLAQAKSKKNNQMNDVS